MQKCGLKRNIIDKFYTKKTIVNQCITILQNHINITDKTLIIEPSAGNGAFVDAIVKLGSYQIFIDKEPEDERIERMDYFEMDIDFEGEYDKIIVLGNPPFGRQSGIAKKFIKKSVEYADVIGFILPRSFRKESMQKVFPLNWHLMEDILLEENSFLLDGEDYDVNCVFQIWEKKDCNRVHNKPEEPIGWHFVKKDEQPDFSFRRVGVYAGKCDKGFADKSEQSHYFIKVDGDIDFCINKMKNLDFPKDDTVGAKSISKNEIIRLYNNENSVLQIIKNG